MPMPKGVAAILPKEPEYLGDGLYVEFDGWQLRLWTMRGRNLEQVYLEPAVYQALTRYVEAIPAE